VGGQDTVLGSSAACDLHNLLARQMAVFLATPHAPIEYSRRRKTDLDAR